MPSSKKREPYATTRTVPFTNREMEVMFDVTAMSLYLWKKGTPTKAPLPHIKKGREVRYPVAKVMSWARRHEVTLVVHPDDLPMPGQQPAQATTSAKKPGPKPKAAAVAAIANERPMA